MDQKQFRALAQMDWEQLIFLRKYFSTMQKIGVGGKGAEAAVTEDFWTSFEVCC